MILPFPEVTIFPSSQKVSIPVDFFAILRFELTMIDTNF